MRCLGEMVEALVVLFGLRLFLFWFYFGSTLFWVGFQADCWVRCLGRYALVAKWENDWLRCVWGVFLGRCLGGISGSGIIVFLGKGPL